jgi:hypothetical protein
MKNIIVVGDSFCASELGESGWPALLANKLDKNLICNAASGQHWWSTRNFLQTVEKSYWESTDTIVFVHTFGYRIPNLNRDLALVDYNNLRPDREIDLAVGLYYKYIQDDNFLDWAQQAWFLEINNRWARENTIHLHAFEQSVRHAQLLSGINILPDLTSISLSELKEKDVWKLRDDGRTNHLSEYNNNILAEQIYNVVVRNRSGLNYLDLEKFQKE